MVNDLHDLAAIEANHEAISDISEVIAVRNIERKFREFPNSLQQKKMAR